MALPSYEHKENLSSASAETFLGGLYSALGRTSSDGDKWVVLASKSFRRLEICKTLGIRNIHVIPSRFSEDLDKQTFSNAADYALATAKCKGHDVASRLWGTRNSDGTLDINNHTSYPHPSSSKIIIACDTVIEMDTTILEKPETREDAISMLKKLSGRIHKVHSGVVVYTRQKGLYTPADTFTSTTHVEFQELNDMDIKVYVDTSDPFDKAGGYGIQGIAGQFVKSINGCFYNVMGLPMSALSRSLAKLQQENLI